MSLNVYIGATVMLIVAAAGMITGVFAVKKRKSRLWIVPMLPLSTTVFASVFMYFLFANAKIVISPWVAVLYIFAEVGALLGCYVNENMESKSKLLRAMVVILSMAMFVGLASTLMLTMSENIVV